MQLVTLSTLKATSIMLSALHTLLSAAETAQSVAREAEKARAALRSTTKQRMDNRAVLESEIAELEGRDHTSPPTRRAELERVRDAAGCAKVLGPSATSRSRIN